jgi:hypothetical protein
MDVGQLRNAMERRPEAFSRAFLDTDHDFDNIRSEPGYLDLRARLQPDKGEGS